MSTTQTITVDCPDCGASQTVVAVQSANAVRWPQWHDKVLDGSLMRFTCEVCERSFRIEAELLYTDLERDQFVGVFPRADRARHRELGEVVEAAFRRAGVEGMPEFVRAIGANVRPRVVFGYGELREKVVACTAGLDDRVIEAVKLMLIQQHPEWPPPVVLELVEVADGLLFAHRGASAGLLTRVDGRVYDRLAGTLSDWGGVLAPLFDGPYVHVATCLTDDPTAVWAAPVEV